MQLAHPTRLSIRMLGLDMLTWSTVIWPGDAVTAQEAGWGWPTWTWLTPINNALQDSDWLHHQRGCAALQGVDVCPPHSLSMESSTPECVGRSLGTNMQQLMHLYHTMMIAAAQLDDNYVDGVSLTHGQRPRKRIIMDICSCPWWSQGVCPCSKTDASYTGVIPPFMV